MSHSKLSTTTFQPSYLLEFPWVKEHPTSKTTALCSWCHKEINIGGMGRTALRSHSKSVKHSLSEKNRQTSLPLMMFLKGKVEDNTLPVPSTTHNQVETQLVPVPASTSEVISLQPTKAPVLATRPQSSVKKYLLSESVTKSEVFWCLQIVVNHIPFRAAARCANSFKSQFPDSEIASKLKLDSTKVGYLVVFGLAPYFERQFEKKLKECSHIVLCFDESLNEVSQRQQMDLHIRWFDETTNHITTRYYTSVFLGHTKASDLLQGIKKAISPESMKKIIQVSMDGPNVNIRLLSDIQQELSESPDSPTLLNIGSCGLHTLHNAFKVGMNATNWDVIGFLRALHNLFERAPARKADYIHYGGSDKLPLQFCSVRWVESGRVTERAMLILPSVRKYVEAMVNNKEEPGCKSFLLVKEKLNDKLLPAKLAFFRSMSGLFEPFLREFQNDSPMSPFLYSEIISLLLTLLEKVVKKDHLDKVKNAVHKVDLSSENLIQIKHFDLGFATKDALSSCAPSSDLEKLHLKKGARNGILAMVKKIIEKSPIKYPLSRSITCLDPAVIKKGEGEKHITKCLEELVSKKWISGIKADDVKRQYVKLLMNNEYVLEQCKSFRRNEKRLDDFFIDLINVEGAEEYQDLKCFIQLILTLSHGNASVERGFSVNKECLVDNIKEESLIALRKVCEGVSVVGGVEKVEMNADLLQAAKNAHSRYVEHLAKQRQKMKDEVQKEKEQRQAAKEKQNLEAERLQVLAEARKRAAELEEKISELNKKCKLK